MKRAILAALAGVAATAAVPAAHAQVSINLGIGTPIYTAPPPVVVAPRPVYVAPPPVVYRGHDEWGRGRRPVVVVHHDDHHDHHDHHDYHDDHGHHDDHHH
ncbi:hypothetical protein AKI39_11360 [Bordetella sp. H567]|uniref:hypothetical protein n=1 Tax=Bordetella sp. H567 TaxID=1697043 RepID=UPI00081C693E|nr:hypothetical protein [Bordetella sp. H567]AOB31169.1 hypothetical protein AKI39_11360 [Bordetella sp. H567]